MIQKNNQNDSVLTEMLFSEKSIQLQTIAAGIMLLLIGGCGMILQILLGSLMNGAMFNSSSFEGIQTFLGGMLLFYWVAFLQMLVLAGSITFALIKGKKPETKGWILFGIIAATLFFALLLAGNASSLLMACFGSESASFQVMGMLFDLPGIKSRITWLCASGLVLLLAAVYLKSTKTAIWKSENSLPALPAEQPGKVNEIQPVQSAVKPSQQPVKGSHPAVRLQEPTSPVVPEISADHNNHPEHQPERKPGKKMIAFGAAGVLVLAAAAAGAFGFFSREKGSPIKLAAECSMNIFGYNGTGETVPACEPAFDFSLMKQEKNEKAEAMAEFVNSVKYQAEPSEMLANGQSVTVTPKYNEALAKELGLRVDASPYTAQVENLPDPWDSYDKVDPEAKVIVDEKVQLGIQNDVEQEHYESRLFGKDTYTLDHCEILETYYRFAENPTEVLYRVKETGTAYFLVKADVNWTKTKYGSDEVIGHEMKHWYYMVEASRIHPTMIRSDVLVSVRQYNYYGSNSQAPSEEEILEALRVSIPSDAQRV